MNDRMSETTATEASVDFGDDDLGRIQGILIGAHARQVDERLASLEAALLGAIADLRTELKTEIATVNKQIDAEETKRSKAMKNLGERVDTEAEIRSETEQSLISKVDNVETSIHASIESARTSMASDSDAALAQIRDDKADRIRLADMFAAVADQLRDDS